MKAIDRFKAFFAAEGVSFEELPNPVWMLEEEPPQKPDACIVVGQSIFHFCEGEYLGLIWDDMGVWEPKENTRCPKCGETMSQDGEGYSCDRIEVANANCEGRLP